MGFYTVGSPVLVSVIFFTSLIAVAVVVCGAVIAVEYYNIKLYSIWLMVRSYQ